MPPKAEILSHVINLKEHHYGSPNSKSKAVEEWSGEEKGVTFHLTKPEGVNAVAEGTPSQLMLGLRGEIKGRRKIEKDFTEALGKPKTILPATRTDHCRVLFWDTSKALDAVFTDENLEIILRLPPDKKRIAEVIKASEEADKKLKGTTVVL